MYTRILSAFVLGSTLLACDENPGRSDTYGALELTTSAPTVEQAFTTADGWSIKYDRFLVHVSAVTVAGLDGVVTASASKQLFDQVAPAPKSLVTGSLRRARPWEDVSLQIGPVAADAEVTAIAPVNDADVERMKKDGFALYVEGKATKAGAPTVAFKWGFTTDTLYKECGGEVGGAFRPGLLVPVDGSDTADVAMRGDVLFRDDAVDTAAVRFDAFAAADADKNGEVTQAELEAVTLESLRTAGRGAYGTAGKDVTTLKGFVEQRTQNLVGSFRAKGGCKATPAAPPQ
ncbi:MAG: hypothetical protein JST00_10365 [Deltaproteobacteria bacterium]|nr:hypothetical protein [Deltaproteobacteria bacterium]